MVQRQKEHVREAIVAAAAELFAEAGYAATTMASVAERAEVSTGNVYRYFPSKEDLFAAVVPADFVARVKALTRQRIAALEAEKDVDALAKDSRYHVVAEELLALCIDHRERIVILLAGAEGTPFASFADDFRKKLVQWALDYLAGAYPTLPPTPVFRFALHEIYAAYLRAIAHAFAAFRSEKQLREAMDHLSAHHLGGLKHWFETQSRRQP